MSEFSWLRDKEWALLKVTGSDRVDFLHRLTTNVLPSADRPVVHNFFLSVNARVEAEFWIATQEECLLLLTPQDHIEPLKGCIDRYHFGEKIEVIQPDGALFVIKGDREQIPETADLTICPDPRLGPDCTWCFVSQDKLENFHSHLQSQGEEWPFEQAEQRRILSGRPRYGIDYDSKSLFVEIAQEDDFSETKGCYPGQEIVARVLHRGRLNRHLRAFRSSSEIPSSWHLKVDGKEVAVVKSTVSTDGGSIGYVMVRREYGEDNTELTGVDNDGKEWTLTVIPRPGEVLTGTEE